MTSGNLQPDQNSPDFAIFQADSMLQGTLNEAYSLPATFGIPDLSTHRGALPDQKIFLENTMNSQNKATALERIADLIRSRATFQGLTVDEQNELIVKLRTYTDQKIQEIAVNLLRSEAAARHQVKGFLKFAIGKQENLFVLIGPNIGNIADDLVRQRFELLTNQVNERGFLVTTLSELENTSPVPAEKTRAHELVMEVRAERFRRKLVEQIKGKDPIEKLVDEFLEEYQEDQRDEISSTLGLKNTDDAGLIISSLQKEMRDAGSLFGVKSDVEKKIDEWRRTFAPQENQDQLRTRAAENVRDDLKFNLSPLMKPHIPGISLLNEISIAVEAIQRDNSLDDQSKQSIIHSLTDPEDNAIIATIIEELAVENPGDADAYRQIFAEWQPRAAILAARQGTPPPNQSGAPQQQGQNPRQQQRDQQQQQPPNQQSTMSIDVHDFFQTRSEKPPKYSYKADGEDEGFLVSRIDPFGNEMPLIDIKLPPGLEEDEAKRDAFFERVNKMIEFLAANKRFQSDGVYVRVDGYSKPLSIPLAQYRGKVRTAGIDPNEEPRAEHAYNTAVEALSDAILKNEIKAEWDREKKAGRGGSGYIGGRGRTENLPHAIISYTVSAENKIFRSIAIGTTPSRPPLEIDVVPASVMNDPDGRRNLENQLKAVADSFQFTVSGNNVEVHSSAGDKKINASEMVSDIGKKMRGPKNLDTQEEAALISTYATLADEVVKDFLTKYEERNRAVLETAQGETPLPQPGVFTFSVGEEAVTRTIEMGAARAPGIVLALSKKMMRANMLHRPLEESIAQVMNSLSFVYDPTQSQVRLHGMPGDYPEIAPESTDATFKVLFANRATPGKEAEFNQRLLTYYKNLSDRVIREVVTRFEEDNKRPLERESFTLAPAQYTIQGKQVMRSVGGTHSVAAFSLPEDIVSNPQRYAQLTAELGHLFASARTYLTNDATKIEIQGVPEIGTYAQDIGPTHARLLELINTPLSQRTDPDRVQEYTHLLSVFTQEVYDAIAKQFVAHFAEHTKSTEVAKERLPETMIRERANEWLENREHNADRRLRAVGWLADLPGVRHIKGFFGWERAGHHSGGMMSESRLRYNRWSSIIGWGALGVGLAAGAGAFAGLGGVAVASIFGIRAVIAGWSTGFAIFEKTGRMRDMRLRTGNGTLAPQERTKIQTMELPELIRRMGDIQADCRMRINRRIDQWLADPRDEQNTYDSELKSTYRALEDRFQERVKKQYTDLAETFTEGLSQERRDELLTNILDSRLKEVDSRGGATALARVGGTAIRGLVAGAIGLAIGRGALVELGQRIFAGKVPTDPNGGEAGVIGQTIHRAASWLGLEDWYQKQFQPFWHGAEVHPVAPPDTPTQPGVAAGAPVAGAKDTFPVGTSRDSAISGQLIESEGGRGAAKAAATVEAATTAAPDASGIFDNAKHSLLFASANDGGAGFVLQPDGKTLATGSINQADLQRALRRVVMDTAKFDSVFTVKNGGEVENSVANLYNLLRGTRVADFTPLDIRGIASYDKGILKIDYPAFTKFVNERLMEHAHIAVHDNSPALRYAAHTNQKVWEHLLEKSAANTEGIHIDPSWKEKSLKAFRTVGDLVGAKPPLAAAAQAAAEQATTNLRPSGETAAKVAHFIHDAYGNNVDLRHLAAKPNEVFKSIVDSIMSGLSEQSQLRIENLLTMNNLTTSPKITHDIIVEAFSKDITEPYVHANVKAILDGVTKNQPFKLWYNDSYHEFSAPRKLPAAA